MYKHQRRFKQESQQQTYFSESDNTTSITDNVRKFLTELRKHIKSGNVQSMWKSYNLFPEITEDNFKASPWPSVELVISTLNIREEDDELFLILYRELYYRHIFDRIDEVSYDIMVASFQNYINLFNLLINYDEQQSQRQDNNNNNNQALPARKTLDIPNAWLWDLINSFIGQFQFYHGWKMHPENQKFLYNYSKNSNNTNVIESTWNIRIVVRYLHLLVSSAKIPLRYNPPIDNDSNDNNTNDKENHDNLLLNNNKDYVSNTNKMLGFFSLVGLLRVHTITCDYRNAVEVMDPLDLRRKSALTRIQACHITAHYYLGFSYIMLKRFLDAHNILSTVLSRYQRENIQDRDKRINSTQLLLAKCYALLGIIQSCCSYKSDDKMIIEPLHDFIGKEIEEIKDSTNVEEKKAAYKNLFSKGCPQFIDGNNDLFIDETLSEFYYQPRLILENQYKFFLKLINNRLNNHVYKLKDELKYYQAINIHRLSKIIDNDDYHDFYKELLQLKCLIRQYKRNDGVYSSGEWVNDSDFDFYIKDDVIYVRELHQQKLWKFSNYFMRNIRQLNELIESQSI